jgi:nitrile hydratase accessory protein
MINTPQEASSTNSAMTAVESIPRDSEGPVFKAPWEAQVFAMTLTLYEQGMFTWPQWAGLLSQEIHRAQAAGDPDLGDTYYLHWLSALEAMVVSSGIAETSQLQQLYQAWGRAARATPHGQPINLVEK